MNFNLKKNCLREEHQVQSKALYNCKVTPDDESRGADMRKQTVFWLLAIFVLISFVSSPARLFGGQIEIVRDYWGVAHVYAETDSNSFSERVMPLPRIACFKWSFPGESCGKTGRNLR